jgi:hypothetical protein
MGVGIFASCKIISDCKLYPFWKLCKFIHLLTFLLAGYYWLLGIAPFLAFLLAKAGGYWY